MLPVGVAVVGVGAALLSLLLVQLLLMLLLMYATPCAAKKEGLRCGCSLGNGAAARSECVRACAANGDGGSEEYLEDDELILSAPLFLPSSLIYKCPIPGPLRGCANGTTGF